MSNEFVAGMLAMDCNMDLKYGRSSVHEVAKESENVDEEIITPDEEFVKDFAKGERREIDRERVKNRIESTATASTGTWKTKNHIHHNPYDQLCRKTALERVAKREFAEAKKTGYMDYISEKETEDSLDMEEKSEKEWRERNLRIHSKVEKILTNPATIGNYLLSKLGENSVRAIIWNLIEKDTR